MVCVRPFHVSVPHPGQLQPLYSHLHALERLARPDTSMLRREEEARSSKMADLRPVVPQVFLLGYLEPVLQLVQRHDPGRECAQLDQQGPECPTSAVGRALLCDSAVRAECARAHEAVTGEQGVAPCVRGRQRVRVQDADLLPGADGDGGVHPAGEVGVVEEVAACPCAIAAGQGGRWRWRNAASAGGGQDVHVARDGPAQHGALGIGPAGVVRARERRERSAVLLCLGRAVSEVDGEVVRCELAGELVHLLRARQDSACLSETVCEWWEGTSGGWQLLRDSRAARCFLPSRRAALRWKKPVLRLWSGMMSLVFALT